MATNEEHRLLEITAEIEARMRTLAHSTGTIPTPSASYPMLGELGAITDHLVQALNQLASWHARAVDGVHYSGEDEGMHGSPVAAADELTAAARAVTEASTHISRAHEHNSVVRWLDVPKGPLR